MQTGKTQGGAMYVLVSNRELSRFGVSFATLRAHSARTTSVIRRILRRLHLKYTLTNGVHTVEAFPAADGCLFLVTPPPQPIANDGVYIFAPQDKSVLPQIAAFCRQGMGGIAAASLYTCKEAYRLLLYTPHISIDEITRLTEFASFVGSGSIAAAHITEHGTAIAVGNALECV